MIARAIEPAIAAPMSGVDREGARAGFATGVSAEWTKLRSVRSTWVALGALVVLTVLLTAFVCSALSTSGGPGGDGDPILYSVAGTYLGQVAVVALGVLAITSEYAVGLIRTTFMANPRRRSVLASKAMVVGTASFAGGLLAAGVSFVVGQRLLRGNGFVPANGYPYATLASAPALRAVLGTAVYLAALSLFAFGLGVLLRRSAGAISVTLGLLYVPVIVGTMLPEGVRGWVMRFSPMNAGLAIQTTVPGTDTLVQGQGTQQLAPWVGLAVFCSYTAVVLLAAFWSIRHRDA
jgi:hypothetical protein